VVCLRLHGGRPNGSTEGESVEGDANHYTRRRSVGPAVTTRSSFDAVKARVRDCRTWARGMSSHAGATDGEVDYIWLLYRPRRSWPRLLRRPGALWKEPGRQTRGTNRHAGQTGTRDRQECLSYWRGGQTGMSVLLAWGTDKNVTDKNVCPTGVGDRQECDRQECLSYWRGGQTGMSVLLARGRIGQSAIQNPQSSIPLSTFNFQLPTPPPPATRNQQRATNSRLSTFNFSSPTPCAARPGGTLRAFARGPGAGACGSPWPRPGARARA